MSSQNLDDPGMMEVTGRVLIATIIALSAVLILVLLFHIYAKWLWHRRQQRVDSSNNNNRRHLDHHAGVTVLRRGLDAAFLKTLPISQFDSKDGGVECSVCLSELEQGEKTRCLPKCSHVFHAECIDMWFHSHSTCPICRNPVSEQSEVSVESLLEQHHETEQQRSANNTNGDFPTNVLFWGDETEVSTLTSQLEEANNNNNNQGPVLPFEVPAVASSSTSSSSSSESKKDRLKPDLVIDIPRQAAGEEEDERTPIMRSLRRILSTGRRFNPFSPSPSSGSGSEQPQN